MLMEIVELIVFVVWLVEYNMLCIDVEVQFSCGNIDNYSSVANPKDCIAYLTTNIKQIV